MVNASTEHQLQDRFTRDAAQRDVLLASVSLEMRAPTHTLSLPLKDLRDDALPANSVHPLRIARETACTVSQLLDDVLYVARFQTNRLKLRPQEFDLPELTAQVREAHAPMALAKRSNLSVDVEREVPRMVHLDLLRLKQVLTNLLSTAVKYTEHGGMTLSVSSSAAGSHASMLEFTVQDSRIGMSADVTKRAFEPLIRRTNGIELDGLGKSICRRLAQMMGAAFVLSSRASGGTTARVTIPSTGR